VLGISNLLKSWRIRFLPDVTWTTRSVTHLDELHKSGATRHVGEKGVLAIHRAWRGSCQK
jgi:hypothetical protein